MDGAEQHPMDADYARLSLRAGHFARMADDHLGCDRFITVIRAHRWHLTPTKLDDWMAEAEALGVPRVSMEMPADRLDELIGIAKVMQSASDRAASTPK